MGLTTLTHDPIHGLGDPEEERINIDWIDPHLLPADFSVSR
jgi:hypothetical protein